MKSKLSKIFGVGLTVALLLSLIVVASPVSADTLKWACETDIPGLPTANNQIVANSDVADMAVSADGKTIYVVTGAANLTLKSTDGGLTWTSLTLFKAKTTQANLVAIAPDDPLKVVVVDTSTAGVPHLWYSSDGGSSASLAELTGFTLTTIYDIDIAPVRSGVNLVGIAGITATGAGLQYFSLGDSVPTWTNAVTEWTGLSGTGAVMAIKWSPAYATDRMLTAVTTTQTAATATATVGTPATATATVGATTPATATATIGTRATATATLTGGNVTAIAVGVAGDNYTAAPAVTISGPGVLTIAVTAGGSGYTSAPTVAISGGGGTGATATATLAADAVYAIAVTAGGAGYTSAPTVAITGGGGSGATATATIGTVATATAALTGSAVTSIAVVSGGTGYGTTVPTVTLAGPGVASITVTAQGTGYTVAPTVTITGDGSGATAGAVTLTGGNVTAIAVATGGFGYTSATVTISGGSTAVNAINVTAQGTGYTAAPTVTISGGGGSGATATATLTGTSVTSIAVTLGGAGYTSAPDVAISAPGVTAITVTSGASGYTAAPAVTISGGGGTGATATATIVGGVVTAITVTAGGAGYTSAPTVTIGASTGGSASLEIGSASTKKWNATGGFIGYPVVIAENVAPLNAASIALAPTYAGYDETTRIAFVGIASSTAELGGIYRFTDYRRKALQEDTAIKSVAYNGSSLLAGEYSSNIVWFSTDMLATTPTVDFITTYQRPSAGVTSGIGKTLVAWAGTNVVAGTSGPNSAFSLSKDKGKTFNDVAILDTPLTNLNDFAVSDNGTKIYLMSDDGTWTSVWRKTTSWERILSLDVTSGKPWQIRTDQPTAAALYVFKKGSSGVELMYSDDSGEAKWSVRANASTATDMAVESAKIAYTLTSGGSVYKTTDGAFTWGSSRATGLAAGNVIVSVIKDQIIVGSNDGYVAYSTDANASVSTWKKIDYQIEGSALKVQVAADKLTSGGNIYVASSKDGGLILRWTIGTNTNTWTTITDDTFDPIYDLQLRSGVLYAVGSDGTDSTFRRTLEPTTATDLTEWPYVDVDGVTFNNAPHALLSSAIGTTGIKLWAIDTTGKALYSFDDTLARTGPTVRAPADLTVVKVNQTTGRATDVAYSWTRLSKADMYDLDIALDRTFTNVVRQERDLESTDATVAALLGPTASISLDGGTGDELEYNFGVTYYWRVRASNPLWSPWSTVRSFSIEGTPAFKIVTPAVGAVDVLIQPTLTWTPYPNAISYEVMVSEDPTFAILTFSHTTTQTFYNSEETLNYSTTYYWRVRGVTGAAPAPDKPAPGGGWVVGTFVTAAKPVAPTPAVTITPPGPTQVITVQVPTPAPIPSFLLWTIIAIGAILVIALVILIVRTRRIS